MEGVCRRIKPVDLSPVLGEPLEFVHVNQGGAKYECDVVLKLPQSYAELVSGLDLGGETARAILRRLPPGQSIPPHVDDWMPQDLDWHRFQLPIVTDPRIVMRWPDDGVEAHLEAGWLYEVSFRRTHEVINRADTERIHLQIDQVYR